MLIGTFMTTPSTQSINGHITNKKLFFENIVSFFNSNMPNANAQISRERSEVLRRKANML
jgi:hypothetical protein